MEMLVTIKQEHLDIANAVVGATSIWQKTLRPPTIVSVKELIDNLIVNKEVDINFDLEWISGPPQHILSRRFNILAFSKKIRHDHKDLYIIFYPTTKLGCEFEALVLGQPKRVTPDYWKLGMIHRVNIDGRIYDKCAD